MKKRPMIALAAVVLLAGCGQKSDEAPEQQAQMPVPAIVARAVSEPTRDAVELVGSLAARDAITLLSELDATVTAIAVVEGQAVEAGAKLFQLDDVQTAARLAEAEAARRVAGLTHERNEGLLSNDTISQQAYDEGDAALQSAEARLKLAADDQAKTVISAPFAGRVGERSVSVGQFVRRGQLLLALVKTDPLEVIGAVPERYGPSLTPGLHVEFKTEAYPGEVFTASIVYVSPLIDSASRTVRIKAEVANEDGRLKPGMFGALAVILTEQEASLQIPESCIQMQGPAMIVVRVTTNGVAEFAPVETGRRSKGRVEVRSGLSDGDLVVVEGWQKMGPGSPVLAAPESVTYGVKPGPIGGAQP
ncbi:MAG: efflux RND transporter periplasmic adaptor subunit [Lentisphaerae bacterium]|nr:efflux RND transporter periplasmic adaptor subunit [Lentisphaerota bacterium]